VALFFTIFRLSNCKSLKAEEYIKLNTSKIKNYIRNALKKVNCLSELDDGYQEVCIKLYRFYPIKEEIEYHKLLPTVCLSVSTDIYRFRSTKKACQLKTISINGLIKSHERENKDLLLYASPESININQMNNIVNYYITHLKLKYIDQVEIKRIKTNTVYVEVFRRTCLGEVQEEIFLDFPEHQPNVIRGAIFRMRKYLKEEIQEGKIMSFDFILEE